MEFLSIQIQRNTLNKWMSVFCTMSNGFFISLYNTDFIAFRSILFFSFSSYLKRILKFASFSF